MIEPSLPDVLREIWQRVLQQPGIADDENFFDLGGDSLLALQLFTEIERLTGRQLPITSIYDSPTVSSLAETIEQSRPLRSSLVVPLSPGEQPCPVFLIHGIGGNVMDLTRLGKSIGGGHPVYALQAKGLDGIEAPLDSVEDMADAYVEAVRERYPAGPYVLVGYSFGGFVALEMARRLEALGDRVALLAFVEAYPHPVYWPRSVKLDVRLRRMAHRAGALLRSPPREIWSYLRIRLAGRRLPKVFRVAAREFAFDESWPENIKRVYDSALVALRRYQPNFYPGRIVFFRGAERTFFLPGRPEPMWKRFAGRLDVITVPGDHQDMVFVHADVLGNRLTKLIAEASPAV